MEGSQLAPGASAFAHFLFQDEVFLSLDDRFILRRFSPVVTIGGGVVLQTVRRKKIRDPEAALLLETLARGDEEEHPVGDCLIPLRRGLSLRDVISQALLGRRMRRSRSPKSWWRKNWCEF